LLGLHKRWNRLVAALSEFAINLSMIGSSVLLLISAGLTFWSLWSFGPSLTVPLLLGVFGLVVAIILLLRLKFRRRLNWVVVDGSNTLYWDNDEPALNSVRLVVEKLALDGFEPILWFDANIGYLIAGRYMNPVGLSKALRYPARRIFVAPKGTPADPLLIRDAEILEARIVTNDRFRDWQEDCPYLATQNVLIRGRIKNKQVHFR